MGKIIHLHNRGVLKLSGEETIAFLNNLLTNNISNIVETPVFTGFLTPQGKYLFDCFIMKNGEEIFIDSNNADELLAKLKIFRLRAKISIEMTQLKVFYSDNPIENGFIDPRNPQMGYRVLSESLAANAPIEEYNELRYNLNVPELSEDLIRDKDFALEGLMDEMGGIDFHKGCYIGQEMTSRMKRRGTLKQKLCSFRFVGENLDFDTPIMAENWEIGRIRSNKSGKGIALIRIDRLNEVIEKSGKLLANNTEIIINS